MRIGADDKVSGKRLAPLQHQLMADARPHIGYGNAELSPGRAQAGVETRGLRGRRRGEVVQHDQGLLRGVQPLRPQLVEDLDGTGSVDILDHHEIDIRHADLPAPNGAAHCPAEHLFRICLSHSVPSQPGHSLLSATREPSYLCFTLSSFALVTIRLTSASCSTMNLPKSSGPM